MAKIAITLIDLVASGTDSCESHQKSNINHIAASGILAEIA
jgi:hypothetical protein